MSDETRYDEATVQLVADCIDLYTGMTINRTDPNMLADAALRTLADAGLLMPPGGETREEQRDHPEVEVLHNAWVDGALSTSWGPLKQRRTVTAFPDGSTLTGPWVEVTE